MAGVPARAPLANRPNPSAPGKDKVWEYEYPANNSNTSLNLMLIV